MNRELIVENGPEGGRRIHVDAPLQKAGSHVEFCAKACRCCWSRSRTTHVSNPIDHALNLSVYTAEAHRGSVIEKLNLHNGGVIVRFALRNGLTRLGASYGFRWHPADSLKPGMRVDAPEWG